jgi:hypothetical protein
MSRVLRLSTASAFKRVSMADRLLFSTLLLYYYVYFAFLFDPQI